MNIYNTRQALKTKSIYDMPIRVVYYARVSTEKEEQKNSIKNQKEYFENLINKNKTWNFVQGYIDDGISGIHVNKREEFQKMLSDAENGKFDLIVTKEISRFARNTLDSIEYTRKLLSYGVCVWFMNDNINTIDEDSELRLTIMSGIAQDEVRKLSSRVRFGHAQSIKNGVVLGNSHIYGYNKEKGRLTINEDEADMVRTIFQKYATGKWTTPMIEKYLYEKGYRNYKGGKINRNVISHIIKNPKYKGWYVGGKVKIIDMFTKKQEFLPEEDWNMFEDDGSRVPAIIDSDTWEKANYYLKERSDMIKSHRTSYKTNNLFTGKIFCANDGKTYWMKQHYVRGKEDVKWVCSHRIKNGASSCNSFGLSENELKKMLVDIIKSSLDNIDDIIDKYLDIYNKIIYSNINDNTAQINRLNKQIESLKKKKDKILDYSLNGIITDEEFAVRNEEFNNQINNIEKEIEKISYNPIDATVIKKELFDIKNSIKQYAYISEADITKNIIDNMIEKINVEPIGERTANIEFYLKNNGFAKRIYENNTVCRSVNTFKKMIEAQEKQMAGK